VSRQSERDAFMRNAGRYGFSEYQTSALLRVARTLQRLSEAQCNGDYPAGNGERPTRECPECKCGWAPETVKAKGCPDCRATARAKAIELPEGWTVKTAGDPRGYACKVVHPCGIEIGVPS